ncbi:hypothetical protein VOLCADRAFT_89483 [Volvox carteri f. nagariensis]|uniref:ABM domain-containing protein n=1 Tax=Volvox carteri f. nagariensis TaxID=3068 RepID=D8TRY5_VOLCA|nr:uncharacterized protein VOLCADRAFT_89483 [Volvox carteri f. nagariensis]EFJ49730.1 hypothetical protein VOLCADRAFT_89483 [Volvox carteri f. nagariensis]|eukprot:XP_002949237.1 hypothetical protein VOLCADRAFT_89483 [Volvox carteri f. nagariensis]
MKCVHKRSRSWGPLSRATTAHGQKYNPSSSDDPLKNLDLKNLNDLPLAKLSETANAVWERIRASGLNVKVMPVSLNSRLLPPNLVPGGLQAPAAPPSNGVSRGPPGDVPSVAVAERFPSGAGKEQRLMAALAEAQEEKRQLADRTEVLRANLSVLEDKNAKMARELASAEAGRDDALRLRDQLLAERDHLATQLREAHEELKRASEGMEVREGALEALRQSQKQLQEELQDAVARLQAVDRSTEELRTQLTSLESSRAAAASERDDLACHLQELVEQLNDLFSAEQAVDAAAATTAAPGGGDIPAAAPSAASAAAHLDQLRATTEGAFAALRVARTELGLLRSENQHLAQRAEALTSCNTELAAAADILKQQVAEARTELDEQRREAAELRSREAALQAELATAVSERRAAEAAVAAQVAQREELAAAVVQLTAFRDAAAAAGLGHVELAQMVTQITTLKEQLSVSRASETELKRRLAAAEVALLDSRRAAAATEAGLVSELEASRRDAAELRAVLHSRTLATQAARRAGMPLAPAEGHLVNTNRFWVPADVMYDFVKAVAAREAVLVEARGFLAISVLSEEHNVMVVSTQWDSPTSFESWSRSAAARRHHYPAGVYQFAPRRGEGVPEDYLPFKDLGVTTGGGSSH